MNLQQSKNRVISVEETQKITKAMQLVATAKLQRLRREHAGIDKLAGAIDLGFKAFRANYGLQSFSFLEERTANPTKTLFIVMYSNFGLCGSYNQLVTRLLDSLCTKDDLIVALGNRVLSQLREREGQVVKFFRDTNDLLSKGAINGVSEEVLRLLLEKPEIGKVTIVSTYFINALTFIPASFNLLNEEIKTKANLRKQKDGMGESVVKNPQFSLEPNSSVDFLRASFNLYLETVLAYTYSHAKLSEMSTRRNAMESASDSAEKLKRELELSYNRIRQASITQEISEIVAANLENKR